MALHCAEKLIELGAIPITLSDSSGQSSFGHAELYIPAA